MTRRVPKRPVRNNSSSFNPEKKYCLDTPDRAFRYCQELAGKLEIPYASIEELINDNDELELISRPMGDCDGALEQISPNKFRITINSNNPKARQRFTMAHEFAHYQLHRSEINNLPADDKILFRDENKDPREYAANEYAAAFLMPKNVFLDKLDSILKGQFDANTLADIFNVSVAAVNFRAKNLGLLE